MIVRVTVLALALCAAASGEAATPLESALLEVVRGARFDEVIDFGPANDGRDVPPGTAKRIAHVPNVDVAVIQLDADGRAVAWANVLLSRDYPNGLVVPVDLHTGAASVRFRRWDIERWNGGTFEPGGTTPVTLKGWKSDPPLTAADDLVPGRENAPYEFMAPYPASLFKLLVAFHVMRMVDAKVIDLDHSLADAAPKGKGEQRPVREWLDRMITVSDNHATRVLLQMMHRLGRIDAMHREFRELGLATLQVNGTRPDDGSSWKTDQVQMTAFDTARLLWLIEGPAGELWKPAGGPPVTATYLSNDSRAFLRKLLHEQAINEALCTSNLTGAPHVRPGIPSKVVPRWINPASGCVTIGNLTYGQDIRASNDAAEVTFAHKTGATYNYGSDAGIVSSLPGKPFRRYVIALLTNLGYRYTDEAFANRPRGPYLDRPTPILYTQRIPALGKAIDDAMVRLSAQK